MIFRFDITQIAERAFHFGTAHWQTCAIWINFRTSENRPQKPRRAATTSFDGCFWVSAGHADAVVQPVNDDALCFLLVKRELLTYAASPILFRREL